MPCHPRASSSTKATVAGEVLWEKGNISCFWKTSIVELLWCNHFLQCRTVKIAILGEEGVPVQVDGEAWIQPPGYIWIVHKNRAQTLTRDRVRAALHTLCSTHILKSHTPGVRGSGHTWKLIFVTVRSVILLHTIKLFGKNVIKLAFTTWEIT